MIKRPARKKIPYRILRIVDCHQDGKCACGCGESIRGVSTNADHRPPLSERAIDETGKDYDPPQLDPSYIEILIVGHHATRTFGSGGTQRITTRDGDIGRLHHNRRAQAKHAAHRAILAAKHGTIKP